MNAASEIAPPRTLGEVLLELLAFGSDMPSGRRLRVYALVFASGLGALWAPIAMINLAMPAVYSSEWSLLVPVAGSGHAVQLESLGQASAPSLSPYANASVDPRVNTKAIVLSRPVRARAAARVGLDLSEFGKPRIKLVDQTAMMKFRISGASAEQARTKARALQAALDDELRRLRADELARREQTAASALNEFSDKLAAAQRDIVAFQSAAGITSLEQFNGLTTAIEQRRREQDTLAARARHLSGRIRGLEGALGLSAEAAGQVLALQNDVEFQDLLRRHADAASALGDASARFGARHFQVVSAREVRDALGTALDRRGQQVSGQKLAAAGRVRALAGNAHSTPLLGELVRAQAELEGVQAEREALTLQIEALRLRIDAGSTEAVALEDLRRKQQVAMAVFTTALAKLDLGKADSYSSYPMLQRLAAPSLPDRPDSLRLKLSLLGGAAASLILLSGLVALWIRKPYIQRMLKSG